MNKVRSYLVRVNRFPNGYGGRVVTEEHQIAAYTAEDAVTQMELRIKSWGELAGVRAVNPFPSEPATPQETE